jgi:hypothetical protein
VRASSPQTTEMREWEEEESLFNHVPTSEMGEDRISRYAETEPDVGMEETTPTFMQEQEEGEALELQYSLGVVAYPSFAGVEESVMAPPSGMLVGPDESMSEPHAPSTTLADVANILDAMDTVSEHGGHGDEEDGAVDMDVGRMEALADEALLQGLPVDLPPSTSAMEEEEEEEAAPPAAAKRSPTRTASVGRRTPSPGSKGARSSSPARSLSPVPAPAVVALAMEPFLTAPASLFGDLPESLVHEIGGHALRRRVPTVSPPPSSPAKGASGTAPLALRKLGTPAKSASPPRSAVEGPAATEATEVAPKKGTAAKPTPRGPALPNTSPFSPRRSATPRAGSGAQGTCFLLILVRCFLGM